ncbi:MAG: Ni/Fe-hydrogenase, b-type cytochrome subunit [Myxococcaceae bacterium]
MNAPQALSPPTGHPHGLTRAPKALYVYEWPVRVWHWLTTLAIFVLAVTGWLIAKPLYSVGGEASDSWVNGWIRTIHFVAAYGLSVGFVMRVLWIPFGNAHSREIFWVPLWKASYWKELFQEVKWYGLMKKVPAKYVGHNPLARFSMLFMFVLGTLFLIVTGFGLYSEGTAAGSWQRALFGWTISFAGSSMTLRTWHHLAMYYVLAFSVIHMYLVLREDIMGRTSMASTMVSGWRLFRDEGTDIDDAEEPAIRREIDAEVRAEQAKEAPPSAPVAQGKG